MKNSKIITYSDVRGNSVHKLAPIDSMAIFCNDQFMEYRHIANMPFAIKADKSVFKKSSWEKRDLKHEKRLHKLSGNYNPRPAHYITITQ